MAVVQELIRKEENGEISFGNYDLDKKSKVDEFEVNGDLYKVKTFREITKLEKNGMFVYESVPGTAVNGMSATEQGLKLCVEGVEDAQITVELEAEVEYRVSLDGVDLGQMKTNLGGKLSFSVELGDACVKVEIVKV